MMDVYSFLEHANDLSNCVIKIWDCNTETVIFNSNEYESVYDALAEINYGDDDLGNYNINSYDIYLNYDNRICIEINIDFDEEDN